MGLLIHQQNRSSINKNPAAIPVVFANLVVVCCSYTLELPAGTASLQVVSNPYEDKNPR
jgi:hypothetical protein